MKVMRTRQGRKLANQAMAYAQSPQGRKQIAQARAQLAKRQATALSSGSSAAGAGGDDARGRAGSPRPAARPGSRCRRSARARRARSARPGACCPRRPGCAPPRPGGGGAAPSAPVAGRRSVPTSRSSAARTSTSISSADRPSRRPTSAASAGTSSARRPRSASTWTSTSRVWPPGPPRRRRLRAYMRSSARLSASAALVASSREHDEAERRGDGEPFAVLAERVDGALDRGRLVVERAGQQDAELVAAEPVAAERGARRCSSASPAAWPKASLYSLKPSRSKKASVCGRPPANAWSRSRSSARRFGRPGQLVGRRVLARRAQAASGCR